MCVYMGVCMRVCARVCVRPTHNVEDMSAQIKPGLVFVDVHGQRVWVLVQGARTESVSPWGPRGCNTACVAMVVLLRGVLAVEVE